MDDSTYTTAVTSPAPELTIETLIAAFDKLPPPLPKPDPTHCCNCHEEMSKPAMDLVAGDPRKWFAPIAGYLCGRCAYLVKHEIHYKPLQAKHQGTKR